MKYCKFVGNSYTHISTNFSRFILIFHQMALIFPQVHIVFTLPGFEYSVHPENENVVYQLFGNDVIFLSSRYSRVLVPDNCKQSITVWFNFYWHCFKALYSLPGGKVSYNDKLHMQTLWQVSHSLVYAERLTVKR